MVSNKSDDDGFAGLYSIVYENTIAFHAEAVDHIGTCKLKDDGIPFFDRDHGRCSRAMGDLVDQALPGGDRADGPSLVGGAAQDKEPTMGRRKALDPVMLIALNGDGKTNYNKDDHKKKDAISG